MRRPILTMPTATVLQATEVHVPTLLLHGEDDRCELSQTTEDAGHYFDNGYRRVLLEEVARFSTRERQAG